MSTPKPAIYAYLASLPIGEQLTVVSAGTTFLMNVLWAGFYEGNGKFLDAGVPVYIPLSRIQYIHH
ncbi:hypothetical protein [Paenibacillus glycanilyticus]|uniref:Uncharacterized protein n=1 Tax=Paenibacillus glycanilyticus TaxID=126569 RepID=A0ABQ6GCG0_9BACL|nr:hypothetical protein [Paenibacillus glycanilyticus]GLX68634.1 hypothetical protein MU1_29790 [Paenibacillus glycanilyticus]